MGDLVALPHCFGERGLSLFEIQFHFGRRSKNFSAGVVELAFPSRDTTVARQLPIRFTQVRPMSINRGTGILPVGQVGVPPA